MKTFGAPKATTLPVLIRPLTSSLAVVLVTSSSPALEPPITITEPMLRTLLFAVARIVGL